MLSTNEIIQEIEKDIKREQLSGDSHTVGVLQHLLWQIKAEYKDI